MVKELREKTGAGMMDCKKALGETSGDFEAAVDWLRKKGQAVAEKRSGRAMKEGLIVPKVDGNVAAMIEFDAETDFVVRNDEFRALAANLAELIFAGGPAVDSGDVAQVATLPMPQYGGKPAGEVITALIGKIGENMSFARFVRVEAKQPCVLTAYVHHTNKLGVLIELSVGKAETAANPAVQTLAKNLAMHVAAAVPVALGLNREDVPADVVARERSIYAEMDEVMKKPEQIREKIIDGKMAKFYKQICLNEQEFVMNPDQTVSKLVEETGKAVGDTIAIARFVRMEVGGGEKAE
jgi:elongation factor Ts